MSKNIKRSLQNIFQVVILDCQHFYGFEGEDHARLMQFLLDFFGPRLVPRYMDLQQVTLNSLNRLRQQVNNNLKCEVLQILIY